RQQSPDFGHAAGQRRSLLLGWGDRSRQIITGMPRAGRATTVGAARQVARLPESAGTTPLARAGLLSGDDTASAYSPSHETNQKLAPGKPPIPIPIGGSSCDPRKRPSPPRRANRHVAVWPLPACAPREPGTDRPAESEDHDEVSLATPGVAVQSARMR